MKLARHLVSARKIKNEPVFAQLEGAGECTIPPVSPRNSLHYSALSVYAALA